MKAVIAPCARFHIFCKTYGCQNTVKWQIGHPQGPISSMDMYCDECVRNMLSNLPEELQPEEPEEEHVSSSEDEPVEALPFEPGFECEQCGRSFVSQRALTSHISKAHKE